MEQEVTSMSIFKQKEIITEEQVREKAQKLILNEFETKWPVWASTEPLPAPAALYAHKIIEEEMSSRDVLDQVLRQLTDTVVEKYLSKYLREAIDEKLTEDVIEGIVQRINNLQVRGG
jgi:hypothetical protein